MPAEITKPDPLDMAVAVVRGFAQDLRDRAAAGKRNLQVSLNQAEGLAIHLEALVAAHQTHEREVIELLEKTGEKSIAEVIGMANVGSSLMERIHILTKDPGPFHAWTPADDPAEIVFDLVNHYEDEATALKLNRDQYQQAYRHWSMIADQRLGASNRSLFRARQAEADAARYRYLRDRDMSKAGLFIGLVPENLILTGADADAEIDVAMKREADHG